MRELVNWEIGKKNYSECSLERRNVRKVENVGDRMRKSQQKSLVIVPRKERDDQS